MIRKAALAIVLGAAAVGGAATAWAQFYENYDRSYRWNGQFPRGSWERTCQNARMSGPILRARCDDGHGRWLYTSIDVRGCPGERIRNTWGRLTCAAYGDNGYRGDGYRGGYGGGWSGGMPGGSWQRTCRDARMSGPILTAACEDRDYRYRPTSIDVRQCDGRRLENRDGRLECD
jgi:hypothetical protein